MNRIFLRFFSALPPRADGAPFFRRSSRKRNGFTLVELLSVVAIMVLLLSISLPALLGSFRDSSLTQAGNQLTNISMLARQHALSHNVLTAVILLTNFTDATLNGRAVSVWAFDAPSQTWIQVSRWMFFPGEIRAYDDPTASSGLPALTDNSSAITFQGAPLPANAYSAFVFNPEGTMYGMPTTARVASIQFTSDPAPTSEVNANLKNYYDLVFSSDTGAIHVVRP